MLLFCGNCLARNPLIIFILFYSWIKQKLCKRAVPKKKYRKKIQLTFTENTYITL